MRELYKPDIRKVVITTHYEPVPDPAWPSTVKLAIAAVKADWWMPKAEREATLGRLSTALEISIRYWGADK